ncbi:MAG: ribbon-helix-helix domain-containing protein [Candidatus Dormibacteraeota bacterium]|nr:ribbon-helix-helix domain-containing protein [Candidatus Dormibacteraeota bacterium]
MKRTTIVLPNGVADALTREARRRNTSVSELARGVLEAHLGMGSDAPRPLPYAGLGRGGGGSVARRMEDLIAEEWSPGRRS